jgi:hypothetical protein
LKAWAVPTLSPNPASATLPDSSAETMILFTLWVVLMILRGSERDHRCNRAKTF